MKKIKLIALWCYLILVLNSYAQINANAVVGHVSPNESISTGNIELTVSGGESPYVYSWSPGQSSDKDLTNAEKGLYSVTITDDLFDAVTYYYNLGYKFNWTDFNGMVFRNDSLLPRGSYNNYPTAISVNCLRPYSNGWMEMVIPELNTPYLIGYVENLSVSNPGNIYDITFGFHLTYSNALYSWDNGNWIFLGYCNVGDVVTTGRNEEGFYIKKNNVVVHTRSGDNSSNLRVMAQINNDFFMNFGCSFADSTTNSPLIVNGEVDHLKAGHGDDLGSIKALVSGGSSPYNYEWYPESDPVVTGNTLIAAKGVYTLKVTDFNGDTLRRTYELGYKTVWPLLNGITATNDKLIVEGSHLYDNPSAVCRNVLPPGEDGWAQMVVSTYTYPYLVGFMNSNINENIGDPSDVPFALHITTNNLLYAYYSGNYYPIDYVNVGDVLKIGREGDTYFLSLNNVDVFNGAASSEIGLKLKAIIVNGELSNIGCSFNTDFNFSVMKRHASYDNLYDGSAQINPSGGQEPYTMLWDGLESDFIRTGLFPGRYSVTVQDVDNQEIVKTVDIGVEPFWKLKQNIVCSPDSLKLKDLNDGFGVLVSNNTSFSEEEAWFEIKTDNVSSDFSFGFIGNNRIDMDSGFVPPVFPNLILENKLDQIKSIYNQAIAEELVYESGQLSLSASSDGLYFVRVHNNTITSLINGAAPTVHTFEEGDILKIGRTANGVIYFTANDKQLFTISVGNSTSKFLLSALILKSEDAALSQMGIFTDATPENYSYRLKPTSFCGAEVCKNWTVIRTFDENGNILSEGKEYYDSFGRPTQQQKLSLTDGYVIATENIYDSYGRPAGATLPAPLFNGNLCYAPTFFSNSSDQHYTVNDFDKPNTTSNLSGERSNPASVGNSVMGTLGWYYSNSNTSNAYVPADPFPYKRIEYSDDPLNRVVKEGDFGRMHKSGSGHEKLTYYLNGGDELKVAYRKIISTNQIKTYELNDNFDALNSDITILQPHKTIQVNEDGHDQITYTSGSGKVLATCVSGNDPEDCASMQVDNAIFEDKKILIHLPKENNNSLKIANEYYLSNTQVGYCEPQLWLYTTKYKLVDGVDYIYNNISGTISFLGDYANVDLFLEMSYAQVHLPTPPDPNLLKFREVHEVSYTNWTVYYYDVKGRLKALISPNEFICQPVTNFKVRSNNGPIAVSCDNTAILSSISLDGVKGSSSDRLDARVEFEPQFTFFNSLKTTLDANDFQLQSDTSLAPMDSAMARYSVNMFPPDSAYFDPDTTVKFFNDSIEQVNYQLLLDSAFKFIGKKKIRYQGNYIVGKRFASGSTQYFADRPVPFDYTLDINDRNASFKNNLHGDKISCFLDSADLVEANEIIVKSTDLRIQVSDFNDSPVSLFNPCDLSIYVGEGDAQLINTINSNVSINTTAHFIATPQSTSTSVSLVDYSKKFYYNEYDHLVATETPDEGRKDYFYDLKEDKLLFTQNDKQRANGGLKFNYIKYDKYGRSVESGEFDPAITDAVTTNYKFQTYDDYLNNPSVGGGYTSVGALAAAAQNLPSSPRCTDATVIGYDLPYTGSTGFNYLNGKVSYIYNSNNIVKYSYDELGRVDHTTENFNTLLPGTKNMKYNYNFSGNLVSTVYQSGLSEEFTQKYVYDPDQRLVESYYATYPGSSSSPTYQPVTKLSYYLHGPLKRKVLGDNMQGLDYVYTIRGDLKSVNSPHVPISGIGDPGGDGYGSSPTRFKDFFGYALDYYPNDYERNGTEIQKTYTNASYGQLNISYTGNIRAVRWNNYGVTHNMYEYNYDELYRLKDADFGTCSINYSVSPNTVMFSSTGSYKLKDISYDRNGNIQSLKRYAYTTNPSVPVLMDDLSYHYQTYRKNKLARVNDNVTANLSLSAEYDFPDQGSQDNYIYNETGQMTSNLTDDQVYEYNSRGLVTKISTVANVLVAEFGYNAAGLRQWKKSYDNTGTQIGTMVYAYDIFGQQICTYERTNFNPGYLPTIKDYNISAGGRVGLYDIASSKPYFEITDHLGNIRVVFTDASNYSQAVTQVTDYYPHGGPIPGGYVNGPAYRYGYQGQEKDPETRLTNFELRQMDPRLGRWLNPDPFAQHHSPYLAMSNNPVNSIDPNGGQDQPRRIYDGNGKDVTNHYYNSKGEFIGWNLMTSDYDGSRARAELRNAAMNSGDAASKAAEEAYSWHVAREARGIKMSNYLQYLAQHRNSAGDWGYYTLESRVELDESAMSMFGAEANFQRADMSYITYQKFNLEYSYKIPSFNDVNFLGFTEARRSAAQSGGGWGTIANIINNVTNPALDMAIGGAEYNLGNVLMDRAKYSFTKAPWESAAIKGTTTIRTPLGNITAATKVLQTTGTVLKVAGATLGAIGMVGTYAQYKSGQIGGAEATVDMIMGAVGFVPGWGWAVSGSYFLGKAIYQYATKP